MSIKKFICAVVLAAFTCVSISMSGCYGKYALTKAVYKWNGSLGNKFIVSLVNYFMYMVYAVTIPVDFILLNTIEFWLGSNPMAMGDIYEDVDGNGNKVYAVKNPDGTLSVTLTDAAGKKADFMLVRNENEISFVDANGTVLAKQTHNEDFTVVTRQLLNADGTVMAEQTIGAEDVIVGQYAAAQ